jgi:hypothetical protein
MSDPFRVRSAENADPAQIGVEFVEDHTEYSRISAYDHTVAWGSRGSGKTMHLRFMEPAAWIARHCADTAALGFRRFLDSDSGFIAVYINCREPALSREEFRVIGQTPDGREPQLMLLSDRYLAQAAIGRLAATIGDQLDFLGDTAFDAAISGSRFTNEETKNLRGQASFLRTKSRVSMDRAIRLFDRHLLGLTISESDATWLEELPSLGIDFVNLMAALQAALATNCPFFLMLDEANELSRPFQQIISSLLARRTQRIVCLKVASQLHGFSTQRLGGGVAQEIHDYVSVDLDALYTNNQDAYYQRVLGIVLHRLKQSGQSQSVHEYLPANPRDVELLAKARLVAEQRYEALSPTDRPIDKSNFVKKYAPAIVFQELSSGKAGKSYAGFDNIVHLSSGIVRSFLDCCSRMYTRHLESSPGSEPSSLSIDLQNETIEVYSDAFMAVLASRIEALQETAEDERQVLRDLKQLITGLGSLFKMRLMDRESREPRIISVSLKDEPDERLARALKLAEQEAYLHKVWYRSKRGTGKLTCYVLNRRLCPHFGLDLAGFQGRIELSSTELLMALDQPATFAKSIATRRTDEGSDAASQMQLWEW